MIDFKNLPEDLTQILNHRFGERLGEIQIPPTSFITMNGNIIEYDLEKGYLKTRFPVLNSLLNQFGYMQGGMLAAAIDNTLGPLSMLIAPPNITRNLDIKFKKSVHPDVQYIFVMSELINRKKRQLNFIASIFDKENTIYVTAKASHWILEKY